MSNDDMDLMNLWFQDVEGKTRITEICQPITDTEARRKFEEAYQAAIDHGWTSTKHLGWQIWKAALNSVVVELPEFSECRNTEQVARWEGIKECRDAIHAAGVRTK